MCYVIFFTMSTYCTVIPQTVKGGKEIGHG